MSNDPVSNVRPTSTSWAWRRVKIAQPPQAKKPERAPASTLGSLLPWPRKRPMTVTLVYRGGPECWIEVRARGRIVRRPGVVALVDLWRELAQWTGTGAPSEWIPPEGK